MNATKFLMIPGLALCLALSGCNSSDDDDADTSSGGGSNPPVVSTPETDTESTSDISSYAGTYQGTATATASVLVFTETRSAPVTITISPDGRVSISSGSNVFDNVTTLNGNAFTYTLTLNNEQFGQISCSGSITLNGQVSDAGKISAALATQNVTCTAEGVTIPAKATGTLNATRI
jgi:hypothetical protein